MKKKKTAVQKPLQKLIFMTVSLRHFYETLLSTRIDRVQIFLNMMIIASLASAIAGAQVILDGDIRHVPVVPAAYTTAVTGVQNRLMSRSTMLTPHSPMVSFVSQTGPDAATASLAGGVPRYSLLWNSVPAQATPVATGLLPGQDCTLNKIKNPSGARKHIRD